MAASSVIFFVVHCVCALAILCRLPLGRTQTLTKRLQCLQSGQSVFQKPVDEYNAYCEP